MKFIRAKTWHNDGDSCPSVRDYNKKCYIILNFNEIASIEFNTDNDTARIRTTSGTYHQIYKDSIEPIEATPENLETYLWGIK